MDARSFSVLLVEDHAAFADALTMAFRVVGRFRALGTAPDATIGFEMATKFRPDLIVADIEQPGRSTFDMISALRAERLATKVVVLTAYYNSAFIEQAIRANVNGYLIKTETFDALCDKLELVMHGQRVFSRQIADLIEVDPRGNLRLKVASKIERLSDRQIDVVRMLARGYSVKEIANEMKLSAKTVDSHKYRVMKMLDLHDRLELARFARDAGIVVED